MELCELNLAQYIKGDWPAEVRRGRYFVGTEKSMAHIWDIVKDIALGLAFLHGIGEVHRDLKPQNGNTITDNGLITIVLYSHRRGTWKLTDFGTAAEGTSKSEHTTGFKRGTESYRAPEVIRDIKPVYNCKSDIWGLGCILYELVTKEKAFASDWRVHQYADSSREFFMFSKEGLRTIKSSSTKDFRALIREMLRTDFKKRPSAQTLVKSFTKNSQAKCRKDKKNERHLVKKWDVATSDNIKIEVRRLIFCFRLLIGNTGLRGGIWQSFLSRL